VKEADEHVYLPLGIKHRIENRGTTKVEFIEVQTGERLDEKDIVRFEDSYGRG
jgi:mannose-1-phosphate guanylyltransferase/mannose-6-phosphate isomerase